MQEDKAISNALQRRGGIGLAHILHAHLSHKREEVTRAEFAEDELGGPTKPLCSET